MSGQSEMDLKRKIAMLEAENKSLKESSQGGGGGRGGQSLGDDGNWFQSMGQSANRAALQSRGGMPGGGIGNIERPVTASAQNAKVREVQTELKNEQRDKKKLLEQIENLKSEIQKQNFSAFT